MNGQATTMNMFRGHLVIIGDGMDRPTHHSRVYSHHFSI